MCRHRPVEAEVRHRLLLEARVPPHAILAEDRCATTLASVPNYLRRQDGDVRHEPIACTDRYHPLRSIRAVR